MTKPTDRQLSEIKAGSKHDLDAILDAWPIILDAAATYYRPNQHDDVEAIGRQAGTHSDPTSAQAFKPNPAAQWSRQARHIIGQLHGLAATIDKIIGAAVCADCQLTFKKDEPTVTSHGRRLHRKCYDAARRKRATA